MREPAWQTLRGRSGFRGLTVVMDAERRTLTAVTLWIDAAARDRAGDRLEPLVEAVRLALGASRAERRRAAVVEGVRT